MADNTKVLFDSLHNLKIMVDKASRNSFELYLDYSNKFNENERQTIQEFRKDFDDGKDIMSILQNKNDNEKKVIIDYIQWSNDLPSKGWHWLYRLKKWVKNVFSCKTKVVHNTSPAAEDELLLKSVVTKNAIDIKNYIQKRWKEQQDYFDRKAIESQKKYLRIQRCLIVLGAVSTLIISLHANGLLNLFPNPEEIEEQERVKLHEHYKECFNLLQENIDLLEDTTILAKLPNPSAIADEEDNVLFDYYKKSYKTLQKNFSNLKDTTDYGNLPNPKTISKYKKSKFWVFIQNLDIEKGICALCSFLIVILSGFDRLLKHYDDWQRNRRNSEKLKRELYSYRFNVGMYQIEPERKDSLFVERVETIINDYVDDLLSDKNKISEKEIKDILKQIKEEDNPDNINIDEQEPILNTEK